MHQQLSDFLKDSKRLIQSELYKHLHALTIPERLKESMIYSMEAGGKRLRPILMLASYQAYGEDGKKVLRTASALEMIHTYSLIHDDLPSMDDDDLRRGQLTNHKMYDEATAILAGDALLTYSFELIVTDTGLTDEQRVYLTKLLSEASGPKGMVGGQYLDMQAETTQISLEELEKIHALKTGELLRYAVRAGAYIGGATEKQIANLDQFAYYLGLLFQVQDDILDITGNEETLGKPIGSDQANQKSTYPNLLGLEGAIAKKEYYAEMAKKGLKKADAASSHLMSLVDYFSNRTS